MKGRFFKFAFFLIVMSLFPLIIFLSRREVPPEKIKVPEHKKQTVEEFTLRSTGKNKWILKAPKAVFLNRNTIKLEKPILEIFINKKVQVTADSAKFLRDKNQLILKNVYLIGENFKAFSSNGTYSLNKRIFVSKSMCSAVFNQINNISGKGCKIDIKNERIIILNKAKTLIKEVKK